MMMKKEQRKKWKQKNHCPFPFVVVVVAVVVVVVVTAAAVDRQLLLLIFIFIIGTSVFATHLIKCLAQSESESDRLTPFVATRDLHLLVDFGATIKKVIPLYSLGNDYSKKIKYLPRPHLCVIPLRKEIHKLNLCHKNVTVISGSGWAGIKGARFINRSRLSHWHCLSLCLSRSPEPRAQRSLSNHPKSTSTSASSSVGKSVAAMTECNQRQFRQTDRQTRKLKVLPPERTYMVRLKVKEEEGGEGDGDGGGLQALSQSLLLTFFLGRFEGLLALPYECIS